MKSRVIIVDDHPIFRMGMAELLNQEKDFVVCGLAEDIAGARQVIQADSPDLAIIDITLAGDNGLDLVKELTSRKTSPLILVLSMHDEQVWAERAIRAGARGYIMKKEASDNVISALRNIRAGKIHVSASIMDRLLDRLQMQPDGPATPTVDMLTDRELQVFRLIGAGLSTREIAEQMKLGIKTIGTYRDRIKQKLGLKSAAELIRRAVLWTEREFFDSTGAGR
jgi:DNA-binding NarL/FixJ family response regulator